MQTTDLSEDAVKEISNPNHKGNVKAQLTTDSPVSHYGIPVLRVVENGELVGDFGPADLLPGELVEAGGSAATAGYWVAAHANAGELDLADSQSFCGQMPEGPQPEST